MAFGGEDDYKVVFDDTDDDWDLRNSNGTTVLEADRKKDLIPEATEMAKPGDTLTIFDKDGGVVKDFNEPRF